MIKSANDTQQFKIVRADTNCWRTIWDWKFGQ